jgi:hypothetical protein
LDQLLEDDSAAQSRDVLPLTVVFVEIPTNPDMKVNTNPALGTLNPFDDLNPFRCPTLQHWQRC